MLKTLGETIAMIETGKLFHISASVPLLKKLPQGNWIGGSTEFFLTPDGGLNSAQLLEVYEMPFDDYKISEYDSDNIQSILNDVPEHGFSLLILPARSEMYSAYYKFAFFCDDPAVKKITGWATGAASIHSNSRTLPITANGQIMPYGCFYTEKGVAIHISVPFEKTVNIGMINIFSPKENGPVINFKEDGITPAECLIDGKECNFSEYIQKNGIKTNHPLITHSGGVCVNVAIDKVKDGKVILCAPVYKNVDYYLSGEVGDYAEAFRKRIKEFEGRGFVFNCNCVLNYIFGDLGGKDLGGFYGPVCYGEIAGKMMTQTLVYVEIV